VKYLEFYQNDRMEDENPTACLYCLTHKTSIRTLHHGERGWNESPWFPSPPRLG
jgi:hypothetical protein